MGALLEQFRSVGVTLVALPDGNLRAHGALSDHVRASIREHKAAILAELAANDCATPPKAAELRAVHAIVAPASPYTSAPLAERDPADDRRTCNDCAHLSRIGRCTAAASGNPNTDAGRSGFPIDDLMRRCLAYTPGADDHDRRSGAERWPGVVEDALRRQAMTTEAGHG